MTAAALERPAGLRAVSLDAAGTLLLPCEPVAQTYAAFAKRHGGRAPVDRIAAEFPRAMAELLPLRAGDPHWRTYFNAVVARTTGVAAPELAAQLYDHFAQASAWRLADGARECMEALTAAGLKVGVLSNWDVRLRTILDGLGVTPLLHAVLVSAEIGADKPDRRAFVAACKGFDVAPNELLHVGDSDDADVAGARSAGCHAWKFGTDVPDFATLQAALVP
ncbi:MAG TPA: HAD-IA family hydrolase [Nannocystaceae bacterium]|nr:HAD-IA family hydrolase [Nannocystaceae bacterium]